MKRFTALLSLCFVSLLIASPALAANLQAEEELTISIPVNDDLYAAGGSVVIEEDITGDAFIVGGEVLIMGDIGDDLVVASGDVEIEGNIGDDLRAVGGEVRIRGNVTDDLIILGGRVRVEESSVIRGDLIVSGGDVTVNGTVRGNIQAKAGSVDLNGVMRGTIDVHGDEVTINGNVRGTSTLVAHTITLGEEAKFQNDVTYWTREGEIDFGAALLNAEAVYDSKLRKMPEMAGKAKRGFMGGLLGGLLAAVLSASLLIGLMVLLTKTYFNDIAKLLKKKPWQSVAVGLLYFCATPLIILLLLMTVIGIPIALALLSIYIFSFVFAKVITAVVIAKWIEITKKQKWTKWQFFGMSLLCFAGLKVLCGIPMIGFPLAVILVCGAYGALLPTKWAKMKKVM